MFKKFKEKVIESQTSQRFHQITQSVSDKFQSLDKDENFFSLTEDDTAIGSPSSTQMEPGFSIISLSSIPQDRNQHRRTSTSSMASDTSFIPRYDSVSSIYHLQSDLDISASEVEDNGSATSSQVGHLSKEQIHSAFQKSQMRYHKYRGRFTDLAHHYKNLEREFMKLKTELEKTQERSFRRVKELKEQCELEQKAKAHLESSLRVDLDEKQIQINTLNEKINFLKSNSNQSLEFEQLSKNLNELKQENEHLNGINQEIKAKLIVFQSKEGEYKEKIKRLVEDNEKLKIDERDNNLRLAESKMQVHNELISKETELNTLRHENDSLKKSLEQFEMRSGGNTRMELLQIQNQNLIQKVENLSQKCQHLDNEMLKVEQYKLEIENLKTKINEEKNAHDKEIIKITKEAEDFKEQLFKERQEKEHIINKLETLIVSNEEIYKKNLNELKYQISHKEKAFLQQKTHFEEEIIKIREDAKRGLISIEEKIKNKYEKDFSEKQEKFKSEYENNLQKLMAHEEKEDFKVDFMKCQDSIKKLTQENKILAEKLFEKTEKYNELEKSYIELNQDVTTEMGKSSKLEKKVQAFEGMEEKISRLQANIFTLQAKNQELNTLCEEQKKEIFKVSNTKELNNLEKVDKLKPLKLEKQTEPSEKQYFRTLECEVDEIKSERNRVMHELEVLNEEFVKLSKIKNTHSEKFKEYERRLESNEHSTGQGYIEAINFNECEKYDKEKNNMKELLKEIDDDFKITSNKLEEKDSEIKMLQIKLKEIEQNDEVTLKEDQDLMKDNSEIREHLNENVSDNFNIRSVGDYNKLLNQKKDLEQLYNELSGKLKITEKKSENQEFEGNNYQILAAKIKELVNLHDQSLQSHKTDVSKILELENKISEMKKELMNKEDVLRHKSEYLKNVEIKLENYEVKFNNLEHIIQDYKETDEKNSNMIQDKNTTIDQLTNEIEVKKQFIKNLEENFKILNKNENDLKKELEKYKSEYEIMSKELVEMETQFNTTQKLYSTEKKDIMKQLHALKQVEKNYYNLLDENENLKEQISEIALLQEKLKSLSEADIEKNILLDNLKQIELDKNILEQEKLEYNEKLIEIQDRYNELVLEHDKVLKNITSAEKSREEIISLEQKLTSVTNSLSSWEEQYKTLLGEYERFKTATNLEKEEFDIKYNNLDQIQNKLIQEYNDLAQKLSSADEERSMFQKIVEKESTENITLKKEIELLKNEKKGLELRTLQLEGYKNQLESINVIREKEKSDIVIEISKLRAENENIRFIYEQLEASKNKLETVKEIMEIEKGALIDENSKLKSEIELSKTEKEDINMRFLKIEASKKELENMNQIIQKEKEDLLYEISKLQDKMEKIIIENQILEKSLTDLNELGSRYAGILKEKEEIVIDWNMLKEENQILHQKNKEIISDYKHISEDNSKLKTELEELKLRVENYSAIKNELEEKEITLNNDEEDLLMKLREAVDEIETLRHDNYELREAKIKQVNNEAEYLEMHENYYEVKTKQNDLVKENKKLQNEMEELIKNVRVFNEERRKYENKINELELNQNELLNEKQLLKEEIEELKISPLNLSDTTYSGKASSPEIKYENGLQSQFNPEWQQMMEKVTQLKSLDITNKATIEFYENEVQKLRNNNEKLNRRLDETLVTLNHCSELSHSTELEYLKNVLYNYMLGKEGLILTRVIATVCKFDDAQTEEVLKKEQQKQTLEVTYMHPRGKQFPKFQ